MSVVRGAAIAIGAAILAACGGGPPPPATAAASATATATVAAATSTPAPSPTPKPTPLVSAKGTIVVSEPLTADQVTSPLTIAGEATVFEATLAYRVVTSSGTVLAQGTTYASAGAPQKGTYRVQVAYTAPYYGEGGYVEVFERSPKDGSISDIVRVPVTIVGAY